ncbi:MAG: hypothetical protein HGA31_04325 [Candidatus Moranbacteria bacterium]|nr:hypothetical protein [Candidatus Moranbacteria bacterium]
MESVFPKLVRHPIATGLKGLSRRVSLRFIAAVVSATMLVFSFSEPHPAPYVFSEILFVMIPLVYLAFSVLDAVRHVTGKEMAPTCDPDLYGTGMGLFVALSLALISLIITMFIHPFLATQEVVLSLADVLWDILGAVAIALVVISYWRVRIGDV